MIVTMLGLFLLGIVAGIAYLVHVGPTIRITFNRTVTFGRVNTEFLDALRDGDVAEVIRAVESDPSLIEHFRFGGESALYHAAGSGQYEVVIELLQRGADVNAPVEGDWAGRGQTPLMVAAIVDDVEMVGLLLTYGARLDGKTHRGDTVYDCAEGKPEILKLLEEASP
jgi:ankyrin repeat protein